MKKKIGLFIALCISCIIPVFPVLARENFGAKESENKKIIVGWYERAGYFEKKSDGTLSGFGYDYLQAISAYTGWEYEFVEGTRRQCMGWLSKGQIDLMSPINVNWKSKNIKPSSEVIGEDYGYLYKKNNNSLLEYNDFKNFKKAIVGVENYSGLEERLEEYCRENKFQFLEIKQYDTLPQMKQAMAKGEIDILVTDSYVNVENMKVVGRFSNSRITFGAVREEIIFELNYAMEQIKLNNPNYTQDLRETYFSASAQKNLEYSSTEIEFLKADRAYNVLLAKDQYPIAYRAADDSGYKGIAVEVLERIEYQTGLSFNQFYEDTYSQGQKRLEKGDVQILAGGILSKQDMNMTSGQSIAGEGTTNQYHVGFYDVRLAVVGNKETDPKSRLVAAIPDYLEISLPVLKELYPHYRFYVCRSGEECAKAIIDKKADVAILTDVGIQRLTVYDLYEKLQLLQYVPGNFVSVFTIQTNQKVLVDVFRKALQNIPDSVMATLENDNLYHVAMRTMSFRELWQNYGGHVITIAVLIGGLIGYRKYLAEKRAKEKAYRDSVANVSSMEKIRLDMKEIFQTEEINEYYAICLDLDKFKVINDLYGYDKGDQTIAFLGKILKKNLGEKDLIARSTADNFIIIKKAKGEEEIKIYLDQVYGEIEEIIGKKDIHYRMILKAGVYRITDKDKNLSSIIDKANLAKRSITQIFESTYQFYDETMREKNIEEKQLENDMETALKNGEFCIYLQPQIELKTGRIVSAEVLVRWKSPVNGLIPPIKFIPVFEQNGFIIKLDLFVWEEAIRTISRWQKEQKKVVPIAINLSRIDVQSEGMLEKLIELMKEYDLDAKWIKTELTESVCMENDTIIMEKMHQLNQVGFKIAVDDFGAGYSSFYLLKEMPIDILKIDKSFLEFDLTKNSKHRVVLEDVINLGKHLDLQIVMEGVETKEQAEFLEKIGCDIAQGYYFSRPISVDEFEALLEKDGKIEEDELGGRNESN